jgi:hypothetical protein
MLHPAAVIWQVDESQRDAMQARRGKPYLSAPSRYLQLGWKTITLCISIRLRIILYKFNNTHHDGINVINIQAYDVYRWSIYVCQLIAYKHTDVSLDTVGLFVLPPGSQAPPKKPLLSPPSRKRHGTHPHRMMHDTQTLNGIGCTPQLQVRQSRATPLAC